MHKICKLLSLFDCEYVTANRAILNYMNQTEDFSFNYHREQLMSVCKGLYNIKKERKCVQKLR